MNPFLHFTGTFRLSASPFVVSSMGLVGCGPKAASSAFNSFFILLLLLTSVFHSVLTALLIESLLYGFIAVFVNCQESLG